MNAKNENLIWIDLEMTGLDTELDYILEIATVVTDGQLNVIADGPVLAVFQPPEALARMDKWNVKQHTSSGLLERVHSEGVSVAQAQQDTLDFLKQYVIPNQSPMCGNSICQDRRFLHRCMSELEQFFHYRNLDVSTLKEITKRWAPEIAKGLKKNSKHRALSDIYDSIEELKYYREHIFKA